ncbi:hypothetical protein SOPP22_10035 [Shewanella sp. OPT22]|nr:hypothetical protein SOPP22_10035 [Shewanella sp. OPT22]
MLTSLLLLTLSSHSVDFNTPSTIEHRSAFFLSQANEDGARVKLLKSSAKPALEQACRKALTLPQQRTIKTQLAKTLVLDIPDNINFIDAEINNYQQRKIDGWLNCTGTVKVKSVKNNEAFLALKFAWFLVKNKQKDALKKVLQIPLNNAETKADAIVLVAAHSQLSIALNYLDNDLKSKQLKLEVSKVAAAEIWLKAERLEQALSILSNCESGQCSMLRNKILHEMELLESEQADDLSSYF